MEESNGRSKNLKNASFLTDNRFPAGHNEPLFAHSKIPGVSLLNCVGLTSRHPEKPDNIIVAFLVGWVCKCRGVLTAVSKR
jgi:hypothetical protein